MQCQNPKCERGATATCSRCSKAGYCSRECIVADWPRHKKNCVDPHLVHAKKMVTAAIEKKAREIVQQFAGNIMISHAWSDVSSLIEVSFTETAQEFVNIPKGTLFYISQAEACDDEANIHVRVKLRDYTCALQLPRKGTAAKIRAKFPEPPSADWVFVTK